MQIGKLVTVALALVCLLAAPAFSKTAKKKPAATPQKSAAKKGTTTAKAKHGRTVARRSPRGQQSPTQERYREIQQALADKGYFNGEVNGVWGPSSVDALTRFQREQNLKASGKLDSRSLISLGLGPKRDAAAETPRAQE